MFFPSWRKLVEQIGKKSGASRGGHRPGLDGRKSRWLWVEQLEDRTLLSTFQWTGLAGNGNWSNPANWSPNTSFPHLTGDVAQFVGTITGATAVTVDTAITIGELDFGTSSSISITNGSGASLTFNNGSGTSSLLSLLPSNTGADTFLSPALGTAGSPLTATVSGGTLIVSGSGTLPQATTLVANSGGVIQINDNGGTSIPNRLGSTVNLTLDGGTFSYIGANNAASTESLGVVTVNRGSSTVLTTTNGTGSVVLTGASLARNTGATVTFEGTGNNLDSAANRIIFTTAPTTVGNNGGVLPYATVVNGTVGSTSFGDFATYDTAKNSIAAFSGYVSSIAAAGPGDIVKETVPETLFANKTITALLLTGAGSVGEAGYTLTISSGGILNTAPTGGSITGGTLVLGSEGIVTTTAVGGFTASFYNLGFTPNYNPNASGVAQVPFNSTPTATRIDPSINYPYNGNGLVGSGSPGPAAALPPGVQIDNLAATWTGTLNIVTGGNYTLGLYVYAGCYIFVDGREVWSYGNNATNFSPPPGATSLPIFLTPGPHAIEVLFTQFQAYYGSELNVYLIGPDTGNAPIAIAGAVGPNQSGATTSAVTTITSTIAGSAAGLTVAGAGTLTLSSASTYTGTTTLAGGTLIVGNNGSLGTGPLNLVAGTLQASDAVTLSNPLTLTDSQTTISGVNNITFTGNGTLSDTGAGAGVLTNALNISNQGLTTFSGVLSGSGSLTLPGTNAGSSPFLGVLPGTGNVILSGANTFSGGTVLAGGSLILAGAGSAASSPVGTGTLTLTSGTLMSDASARTLSNPLTLAGNLMLSMSANGGTTVSSSSLTFSGAATLAANSTLTIQGGSAAASAVNFSGNLSGSGQLTISGSGALTLSGAGNTYSGGTVLSAGSLGALGTLTVANGTDLGTGPLTLTDGTLAASSAGVTIANPLTFTDGSYVAFGGSNPLTFANASTTNGVVGTANLIVNASATIADALGGSGNNGGNLNLFSGSGTLTLTGASTFTGNTTVNSGTLTLSGANGSLTGTSNITVNSGATLSLVNTAAANNSARLPSGDTLTLNGGTFSLTGPSGGSSSQVLAGVTLASGNSTIVTTAGTGSGSSVLLNGGVLTENLGATVNFQAGAAGQILGGAANQVQFSSVPLVGNIIQGATVTDGTTFTGNTSGYNLAVLNASSVAALTSYAALSASGANNPTDNVLVTASTALTANDQVNAMLIIGSGITVSGSAGTTLTVNGGMVASSAAGSAGVNAISVPGGLAFGAAEGIVLANTGSVAVSNISGTGGLVIGGSGTVVLPTGNSYNNSNAPPEIQTITITGNPTGGTYQLGFNGAVTSAIPFTANASAVAADLQALPTIGAGNVQVKQPGGFGPLNVQFIGALAGSVQAQLVAAVNSLTGGNSPAVAISTLTSGTSTTFLNSGTLTLGTNGALQGGLTVTGGTLQATVPVTLASGVVFGTPSAGSALGAAASSAVTLAGSSPLVINGSVFLNGLTAQITVTNTAPTIINGFIGNSLGLSPTTALVKQGAGTLTLTGANTYSGVTLIQQGVVNIQNNAALGASGNAVQTLTFGSSVSGGTFTLAFNGATTGPITYATQASIQVLNIQLALDLLPTIGLNNTTVTTVATAAGGTGPVTITFQNQLGAANVPLLTVNTANLTGTAAPTVSLALTTPGSASGVVVSAGATLQLQGGLSNVAKSFTLAGSGAGGAGALVNLTGNNTLTSGIALFSNTTVAGDVGTLTLGGNIIGAADLTKSGGDTLSIAGTTVASVPGTVVNVTVNSSYTGETNINGGVLQLNSTNGLGSNTGGVIVTSGATLSLGTGTNAPVGVRNGGWLPVGSPLVSYVGTIAGKALTLNGSGFGLASSGLLTAIGALQGNSISPVTWTGNINLSGNATIGNTLGPVSPGPVFTISGSISGLGGLTKVGAGTVALVGQNSYAGTTNALVGLLTLTGSGTIQPTAAPGVNEVQTITLGGTVSGGSFTLTFNGVTTGAINWNSAAAVLASNIQSALVALSSIGAGNAVVAGAGPFTVTFQGLLGITNLPQIAVAGNNLTGTSPTVSTAITTNGAASISIGAGATFSEDNSVVNLPDRIAAAATFSLDGGTFSYLGNNTAGATSTESVGVITLGQGASTLNITSGTGAAAIFTSAGLFRVVGATVSFSAGGTALSSPTNQLLFTNAPALTNGILPYATVLAPGGSAVDFAAYAASGGIAAFANYATSLATAGPTSNVKLTAGVTLSSNVTVNSLLLVGTLTVTGGAGGSNFTINLASGGLAATGGGTATLTGGTINFGAAEGIILAGTGGTSTSVTIGSSMAGSGGLTMSGAGTITLNATGFFSGTTTYNGAGSGSGTLALGIISALGNNSIIVTGGIIGPSYGGNFGVFANPITLNNSVADFGLANTHPTFAGPITLIGNDFLSSNVTPVYVAGTIGGSGSLTIGPTNALVLEGNNTYTGGTNLNSTGEVDVTNNNAFGTGPINWLGGQINQFRNVAGPSVEPGAAAITLANPINLVNSSVTVVGPYGTVTATGTVTGTGGGNGAVSFTGPISLSGTNTVTVGNNQNLSITSVISGAGSLNLAPAGALNAGGALNVAGALNAAGAINSTYDLGTVTLSGANIFTGGVNLTGTGTVILGNSSALGTGIFDMFSGTLQDDGVHTITVANPIIIDSTPTAASTITTNSNTRTINATNASIPLTFTGVVNNGPGLATNTVGAFLKAGPGNLVFTSPMALDNSVTVGQGSMTLSGGSNLTATALTVNPGATFVLDNNGSFSSPAVNSASRLTTSMPITLAGGTLSFLGNNTAGSLTTQTVGAITLNPGSSTISSTSGTGAGAMSVLTIGSLTRNPGALLNFAGVGSILGGATNQVIVTGSITPAPVSVTNGIILPFATVTGPIAGSFDFASLPIVAPFSIAPFTGYTTAGVSAAGPNDVVKVTASDALASGGSVGALLLSGNGITIGGSGGTTLNVTTGAVIATGATTASDNITANVSTPGEQLFVTNASAGLIVSGTVTATDGMTTGGAGTLTLSGSNNPGTSGPATSQSAVTETAGTLVLNNNNAIGPLGNFTITAGAFQAGASGGSGGVTLANPVVLATLGAVVFSGANPMTISGVISGTGGLTVSTSSSLTYTATAANTYTGTTTVNAGTLLLSKPAFAAFLGPLVINLGTVQETTAVNQFVNQIVTTIVPTGNNPAAVTTAVSPIVTISGGGTLALGANPATVDALEFINGGAVTMTTGTLSFSTDNGSIQTLSTNGSPSLAAISGGTVVLPFANTLINVASSGNSAVDAVQSLTINGTTSGGTFTLAFNGQTTTPITYSATATALASNIQAALNALNNILAGGTSVTVSGSVATVTFLTQPFGTILPLLAATTAATNSVQTINFAGAPSSGTFTLAYSSQTTAPITYSTAPTALQANILGALNKLAALGATNAVQIVTFTGTPTAGTFTLTFNGQTTAPINYSTVAATLEANTVNALNTLSTIQMVNGVGTNSANVAAGGSATAETITFQNALGGTALTTGELAAANVNLTAASGTPGVSITTTGSGTAVGAASTANGVVVSATNNTNVNVTFQNGFGGGLVTTAIVGTGLASNAQQQIPFGGVTAGNFTLAFNGQTTSPITYSATATSLASMIQAQLNLLQNIGSGGTAVTVSVGTPTVATVTFQGALAGLPEPIITVNAVPVNTVENIAFPGGLTGGTFTLIFGSSTTAAINYSTNPTTLASSIQTALGNLSAIGSGNVSVTGVSATSVNVTFLNTVGGGAVTAAMTGNGTTVPAVNQVQTITFPATATGGTFTLTFGGVTTGSINYSTVSATLQSNIQSALNGLSTIGAGNTLVNAGNPTAVTVTLQGTFAGATEPVITASGAAVNEVKTVTFTGTPTGSTFTLTFAGQTTAPITYSQTPGALQANMQSALDAKFGAGNTLVLVNATATSATVTLQGTLGGAPQTPMTATGTGVTVATTTSGFVGVTGGANQVVTAAITTAASAAGLAGLLGTGNQAITVTVTTAGTGLNSTTNPTTAATVRTGGQGGLSASNQSVPVFFTTGFGLSGSNVTTTVASVTPGGGDLVIASTISGGSNGITKVGPGILTFASTTANTFTGATNVNEGTLWLGKQAAVAAISGQLVVGNFSAAATATVISNFAQLSSQNIYVNSSSTLNLSTLTTASQSIGSLDIKGGTVLTGTNTVILGGDITAAAIGTQSGTLSGKVDLGTANRNIFVLDSGTAAGLNLSAAIASASGTFGITKAGSGTLILSDTAANTFTGTTTVNEGTLLLSSPLQTVTFTGTPNGGAFTLTVNGVATGNITYSSTAATLQSNVTTALNALSTVGSGNYTLGGSATALTITFSAALASVSTQVTATNVSLTGGTTPAVTVAGVTQVPGNLVIGNSVGGSGASKADVVRLFFGSGEISTNAAVTVNNSGLLDLSNKNQTIAGLTMSGGTVSTGTGTLTLGGGVTGTASAANQTPATISGNLSLGTTTRLFDVQQGALGGPDMVISAVISGAGGLTKASDPGTLQLTAANTYIGPTTVALGSLQVDGSLVSSQNGNTVQTITIAGGATGGTFTLTFNGITTSTITYSTVASTLQANIQNALNGLFGASLSGVPNAVVSASSATTVTVTFQGALGLEAQSTMTATGALTGGSSAAITVAATAGGFASSVTVSGAGVLSGTGSTGNVAVTAGGTVSPGDPGPSKGILTVTSPVGAPTTTDLSGGGNLTLRIGGYSNTPTQSYDQLKLTGLGVLKLGGTSTLTLNLAGLTADGTASAVVLFSGLQGTFSTVNTINNALNLTPVLTYQGSELDINFSGQATHFAITKSGGAATAGTAFPLTVTALDQFNNTALAYSGTIQFTKSDSGAGAVVPANYTFVPADDGVHVFTATNLVTAGSQTVTATDVASSAVTGNVVVTVNPGAAQHFAVNTQGTVAAGHFQVVTVTAQDQFNNTATGYTGTVQFTSSDSQAVLSSASTLTSGVGFFGVQLKTAGMQTVTATDVANSISGISGTVNVVAGAVAGFLVAAPSSPVPGTPFTITVTARDAYNNPATSYAGTVQITSSDPSAVLPANNTLASGSGTFSVTLKSAGAQTITATDTHTSTITGAATVNLTVGTPNHFVISAPSAANAGTGFVITVTAKDALNNTATAYAGTINFSSTDPQAVLPANATLTSGVGFFAVTLKTAGSPTITATDTASSAITGTSLAVSVTGLAANHFAVSANANAITGSPVSVTVKAEDQFGNIFASYSGIVHITSSDSSAVLPANSTLTTGSGVFNVILKTPGTQTVSATDTMSAGITGTSNNIFTLGLVVTSFTVTSTGFIAVFDKPFNPTQINLYDAAGTYGPDDVLLSGGPGTVQTSIKGSLIIDPTDTTITYVKTSTFTNPVNSFNPQTGVLAAGTYTVTFRSASNGFVDLLGAPLDGTASGNPAGSNYVTTFVVGTTPPVVVGVPGFARGPGNTVTLPNNAAGVGIPVSINNGSGVTSGQFTLQYNTALLTITGATVNSALTGATMTLDPTSTAGNAVIDFSSTTALASGPVRLGGLVATVPNSAGLAYKSKALLHFSSVLVNNSAATGDDAVDVDAYFGDTNGDGVLSGGDASDISRVASGVDNNASLGIIGGFSAYPLADPVQIGDLSGSGSVGAASVTLLNSFLSGTPRTQIPAVPTGLTIVTTGPDPSLSLGGAGLSALYAAAGSTVIVPVNIDTARPAGSTGMLEAILAVKYDPTEFTVSAADVELGSLPLSGSGWQLQTAINAKTGEIGIDLFSNNAIQTTAGGSLVTIALQVRQDAPAGQAGVSLVTSVDPTGQRVFETTVSDAQGAFTLHSAVTAQGVDQLAVGSGQLAVSSGQVAASSGQLAVVSNVDAASTLPTTRSPLPTVLEQVFGEMAPMLMVQETALAQPGVILNSDLEGQTGTSDPTLLQQIGVAQHDWVPTDLVAYLGQTAKASRRSPLGDVLDDAASTAAIDMAMQEEFLARQAGPIGQ